MSCNCTARERESQSSMMIGSNGVCKRDEAESLKRRVGCDKFLIHESDGRSGGLLMLWKKEVVLKHLYIDVVVGEGGESMGNQAGIRRTKHGRRCVS